MGEQKMNISDRSVFQREQTWVQLRLNHVLYAKHFSGRLERLRSQFLY